MDLGLLGSIVAVAAPVLTVIGLWAHRAVGSEDGRATIIRWLESGRWWQRYHDTLRDALGWLDRTIDPPPFSRKTGTGHRWLGIKSLGVCLTVSMIYSLAALLIGWVASGPSDFGHIVLLGQLGWAPPWLPGGLEWLPRLLAALLFGCFGAFSYWFFPAFLGWVLRFTVWLAAYFDSDERRTVFSVIFTLVITIPIFLTVTVGITVALVAVAFVVTGAAAVATAMTIPVIGMVATAAIIGANRPVILAILGAMLGVVGAAAIGAAAVVGHDASYMFPHLLLILVLPCFNGVLDWISLNVSRWFGRGILAEGRSVRGLAGTVLLTLADLVAALVFLFAITWFLAFGVEALGIYFGVSLELDDYVRVAVAHPWSGGLWVSIMVLSTLLPTAIHFVLALAAVWFAWFGNPVGRWCAAQLRDGTAAHYLGPELYLVFGWTVPVLAVPLAMGWGLSHLFALVEPLPDAILATALDGIATAQAWFG